MLGLSYQPRDANALLSKCSSKSIVPGGCGGGGVGGGGRWGRARRGGGRGRGGRGGRGGVGVRRGGRRRRGRRRGRRRWRGGGRRRGGRRRRGRSRGNRDCRRAIFTLARRGHGGCPHRHTAHEATAIDRCDGRVVGPPCHHFPPQRRATGILRPRRQPASTLDPP